MIAGQKTTVQITRLTVTKIVPDAQCVGKVWFVRDGHQDIFGQAIVASTEIDLGPFATDCLVRVECSLGSLAISQGGDNNSAQPDTFAAVAGLALSSDIQVTPGDAVADATGAGDVVATVNDLLASLRASGAIASP